MPGLHFQQSQCATTCIKSMLCFIPPLTHPREICTATATWQHGGELFQRHLHQLAVDLQFENVILQLHVFSALCTAGRVQDPCKCKLQSY